MKNKAYDLVLIALFVALMAICAWITIPAAVPFTMQTFGVFLALLLLGGKRGTICMVVYLLLGAVGYTIAVAIVCLDHTFTGYIMYALLSTIVSVFISNLVLTSYLSAVQNDSFLCQHGAEVHLLREVFVASGRVIGLLPAFLMPDPTKYAAVMMLLFAAVQIPAALLTKYLQRRVNLEQST